MMRHIRLLTLMLLQPRKVHAQSLVPYAVRCPLCWMPPVRAFFRIVWRIGGIRSVGSRRGIPWG